MSSSLFLPDAAIIDLDGTLVDTLGDFVAALNLMAAELQGSAPDVTPFNTARVDNMVGKGSEHLVMLALRHLGLDAGLHADALAAYQRQYSRINGQYSNVYPGALEGLQQLKAQGVALACLTNKPLAFAKELLALKKLDGFFPVVFGGDSFERKKPDPLPLIRTCEALGTVPARTLMLGDSSNDAQAARAAACPVVLVTYGYNHGEPVRAVDADGFVDSIADLMALLK